MDEIINKLKFTTMYTLSQEQLASLEGFIDGLDETMIKSRIQRWFDAVDPQRVESTQLEEFVGFATHLPKEVQDYPQAFAFGVRNGDEANSPYEEPDNDAPKKAKPAKKKVAVKATTKKK